MHWIQSTISLCNFISFKLLPKSLKVIIVLKDIEWMIRNQNIFLVCFSSLTCEVERSGHYKFIIRDQKLVMHMSLWIIISSNRNSSISKPLNVASHIFHTFIICKYLNCYSSFMSIENCISNVIICEIKYANLKCFYCL